MCILRYRFMDKIIETLLKFLKIEGLVHNITGYVETKVELFKIEIREEVARVTSTALMVALVILFALLALLFVSFGLASYLNSQYESMHLGHWIVGGIYILLGLILLIFRRKIAHSFEKYLLEHAARKRK
jgi:uncharacterized membrane protein YqjE